MLRQQLDRRARVLQMQDANAASIGYSATKVMDARERSNSPAKRMAMSGGYMASTAAATGMRRTGSPLRTSYKA